MAGAGGHVYAVEIRSLTFVSIFQRKNKGIINVKLNKKGYNSGGTPGGVPEACIPHFFVFIRVCILHTKNNDTQCLGGLIPLSMI